MTDKFSVETKYWHEGEIFDIKGKLLNVTREKMPNGDYEYSLELLVENDRAMPREMTPTEKSDD